MKLTWHAIHAVGPWPVLLVHFGALALSLWGGGQLVGWLLGRLKLNNADVAAGGADGAGRMIGYAERLLVYLAVACHISGLLAVLVGVKTLVRYPAVRVAAEAARDDGGEEPPEARFAEYYLVGTLSSVAVGVLMPILARLIVAWMAGFPT